jgi:hypothetical protein
VRSSLGARRGRTTVAAATLFMVVGGIAYASIPDASGVIHGCYRTSTDDQKGQLRVVEDAASCRTNELPMQWNQTGPDGPAGKDGAAGVSPTVRQLVAGDQTCAAGGAAITDAAGSTAYVCSGAKGDIGADGADGDPFSGTFASPNGEYSISVTDNGVAITSPDSSIRVSGTQIRIDTMGSDSLVLKSSTGLEVESGVGLSLKGGSTVDVRSAAGLLLKGGGTATLEGSAVRVGGGMACAPAARLGDAIAGTASGDPGPFSGTIIAGTPNVCIG